MKQMKHSLKRDAIYSALASTKTHPCAEWIYSQVKSEIPDLSLATVYRNLAYFRASGQAVLVATVNSQERYDADTHEHTHFICNSCHSVADVNYIEVSEADAKAVEKELGVKVFAKQLNFYGLCAKCLIDKS